MNRNTISILQSRTQISSSDKIIVYNLWVWEVIWEIHFG